MTGAPEYTHGCAFDTRVGSAAAVADTAQAAVAAAKAMPPTPLIGATGLAYLSNTGTSKWLKARLVLECQRHRMFDVVPSKTSVKELRRWLMDKWREDPVAPAAAPEPAVVPADAP